MKRRVAITGVGLIDPLGQSMGSFFDRTVRGESSIRHYVTSDIPVPVSIPGVFVRTLTVMKS